MSATSMHILEVLDRHAGRFEFPILDNASFRLVAGRLRGFRRDDDWGILFEILVFAPAELSVVVDVYAYGPLAGPKGWRLFQVGGIDEDPKHPLWDEEGRWIPGAVTRKVLLGGQEVTVVCGSPRSGAAVLQADDCANEVVFARSLIRELGFEKLVPLHIINDTLPGFAMASEAFAISDWDHPDVSRGETPSESDALRAAAKVLSGETEGFSYAHLSDNLSSSRWEEGA